MTVEHVITATAVVELDRVHPALALDYLFARCQSQPALLRALPLLSVR